MTAMPEVAGTKPIRVPVEAGKSYWWCACSKSKKQPFCDGSHKGYKATAAGEIPFCACKRSSKKPTCDGTHKTLAPPAA